MKYGNLFESAELAHEVAISHGMVKGIGNDWFAPNDVLVDRKALHHDLLDSGFEHEHSSNGVLFQADFYKNYAGTLSVVHGSGHTQAAFTTNGIPYRQRYPNEKYDDFKEVDR